MYHSSLEQEAVGLYHSSHQQEAVGMYHNSCQQEAVGMYYSSCQQEAVEPLNLLFLFYYLSKVLTPPMSLSTI